MLITVRGRVEMDPMRVPGASTIAAGRDDAFEQVLQQAVDAEQPQRVDERHPTGERVDDVDEAAADAGELASEPAPAAADDELPLTDGPTDAAPHELPAAAHAVANAATAADDTRRGEPVRQETAGKGADSPRPSSRDAEPLLAAVVQRNAGAPAPFAVAERGPAVAGVGATRAAEPATRGVDAPFARAQGALRGPAVAASYRTSSAASAELIEQARDSVFKQILVQLTGDGGEMRLRLQPPDLGELDLQLVVENGNRLSLTIAAERTDLADLLQRHLDELKHTLQQAGLDVASASVQTRSEFARSQQQRDAHRDDGATGTTANPIDQRDESPRRGLVSATGLDFWA